MEEITINPLLSDRRSEVTKEDNRDAQLGSHRDYKRHTERLILSVKTVLSLHGYITFVLWL